ncbi:restriction endonuclease subunit S [Enterococcus faecium]|uniref:restriction endonuclease subunit S n=1 Tax=Enterococcus faecium TaxID=1352 RepID=UPI000CF1DB68|nr:restriction endonuclease subunit S [Enterococcus faecium]PQE97065.1 restriction endonuclease subunit S [Enterococcus faecium]
MSKDKQPEIRFPGFTEDWEERKLDEIFGKIRNAFVGTATPYYVDEGHFYLESNNVKDGRINRNTEVFINDEFYEKQKDKWLHTNDIVMVQSGHVGHTAVIPEDLDKTAAHALIMFSNYKTKTSPFFLNYQFQTLTAKRKLENITTGNTIKHILASEMKKFEVTIPEHVEQQKIGSFFKTFDDTIALHQRKLDLLKETKKGFLQKMFPKNGAKVPEIRFPGFTGDWEERKLSDIADKAVDNRGKTPTISEDGNHPLLEVASLGNGAPDYSKVTKYLSDETFMAELRAYIKEGDILFSTVGSIGLVSLMDTNENAAIAQNIVAFRANEKYDSKFLYAMLSTKDNQHKAQRIVMGAVQPSIKVSQLVDVDYCVTENMEEQRKLGEYFLNLDNLITLHQRKLDLLKETKKGFLQKMFV